MALKHTFLLHVSAPIAFAILVAGLCLTVVADSLAPPEVWFGPIYLFIVSFAAWALSARLAIGLGFAIIAANLIAGGASPYPNGSDLTAINFVLRFMAVLMVVGLLTIARRACEIEWRLARTDPLTGALNRQAFFEAIRDNSNSDSWSALVFADLNGLKALNDQQGHDFGDKSLRQFSKTVKTAIRTGDLFARMGGDEFALFMKVKNEEAGHIVAIRLNRALNDQTSKDECVLQCSLGVLLLPPGPRNIDAELKAADELMYSAKKGKLGFATSSYLANREAPEPQKNFALPDRARFIRAFERTALFR